MTATCTAPEANTPEQAIAALIAVRDNFNNLADQVLALIGCCDQGDDGADSLADRARLAQVPRSTAMRKANDIGNMSATAAGHLRRAEKSLRDARAAAHHLADVAQEAANTGRH